HPGVFVAPSHEAVARARAEGIPARMLPAVSAEDCLFADLGIDPGRSGCQSYGASYFLARRPPLDTAAHVLLWQISVVGERRAVTEVRREGLVELTDALLDHYAPTHEVVVYEASPYSVVDALVERLPLRQLPEHEVTPMATLVIPPA
ncbi:MAG TPA: SAM-dependent methyltransferase, partial [Gaiellaceae bacterium]|nr:SAM-dependent methyltransferase [Gaiellaceae bacterium]